MITKTDIEITESEAFKSRLWNRLDYLESQIPNAKTVDEHARLAAAIAFVYDAIIFD